VDGCNKKSFQGEVVMAEKKTGIGESEQKKKKSIVSTGSPKKATPKSAKKKPSKKAAPKKKVTGRKIEAKKTAKKKAAPKKKAPAKKTAAAISSAGARGKKSPASKIKPVSKKELLFKKFHMPLSGKKYVPLPGRRGAGDISSPPFFVGATPEETERVRALLFKNFDDPTVKVEEKIGVEITSEPKPISREQGMPVAGAAVSSGKSDSKKASGPPSFAGLGSSAREKKPLDPAQKMVIGGIACLAVLLAMVLWSSASNFGEYYVKPVNGSVEIWKGKFSPKGVKKVFTLGNASIPADLKEVYSKEEAFALIFDGIINDADALLTTEDMPNFDLIRRTLESAQPFVVSGDMSSLLQRRLDKINMMALVYKADVFAGKGTVADLKQARESLEKALQLYLDEAEKGLVEQKIAWIDQKLAGHEEE
jgi:hypothetical protein